MEKDLLLNNTIRVRPSVNQVVPATGIPVNLEQRVMQVLLMLAAAPRQVVTREKIIKEVWNDYGGADEGLNQVISTLRKILNDTGKKLIETVPKKGYILHATITDDPATVKESPAEPATIQQPAAVPAKKMHKLKYILGAIVVIAIILVAFFTSRDKRSSPDIIRPGDQQEQKADSGAPRGADVRE